MPQVDWMDVTGSSRIVCWPPCDEPPKSTPVAAPSSITIIVQPVGRRGCVKWPALIPGTSVIDPAGAKLAPFFGRCARAASPITGYAVASPSVAAARLLNCRRLILDIPVLLWKFQSVIPISGPVIH